MRTHRPVGYVFFQKHCHLHLNILDCQSDENDGMTAVILSTAIKEKIMTLTANASGLWPALETAFTGKPIPILILADYGTSRLVLTPFPGWRAISFLDTSG